jgi:hypothetical protein
MKTALTLLFIALLTGCSSVKMKEPFPMSQLSEKECQQLEGTWHVDDEVVQVAFTSNGVAQLAWMEWENETFQLKSVPVNITKKNETLYISLRIEDEKADSGSPGYVFFELKPSVKQLILWPPNVDFFKTLVKSGKLDGSVTADKYSDTVFLNGPAVDILELITTNAAAFDYKDPAVFQRVE